MIMSYKIFTEKVKEGVLIPKDGPATLWVWVSTSDGLGEDSYLYDGNIKNGEFQSEYLNRALIEGLIPPSSNNSWEIRF